MGKASRFDAPFQLVLISSFQQLDPTIQGSEAAHEEGLEQTLFERITKMVRLWAKMKKKTYGYRFNVSGMMIIETDYLRDIYLQC